MYEVNRNAKTFVKTNCVVQMQFVRLLVTSVDVYADLVMMEIHWTVVLDVDLCRYLVDNHQIVQLTRIVTIKSASLPVTTIWNVA